MEIVKGKYYKYNDVNSFTLKALANSTHDSFKAVVVLRHPNIQWEVGEQSDDWSTRLFVESDLSEFLVEANKRYPLDSQYESASISDNNNQQGKGQIHEVSYEAKLFSYHGSTNVVGVDMGAGLVYNFHDNEWAVPRINEIEPVECQESAPFVKEEVVEEKVKENKTQKLTRKGLKEIHSVACGNWKNTLIEYGRRNPLEDYVEFSQKEVEAMFKACTPEQLPIVSKYLKQDDYSVDLSTLKWSYSGGAIKMCYLIRYDKLEGDKNDFWLNNDYNWEVKNDSLGNPRLVPTRKK